MPVIALVRRPDTPHLVHLNTPRDLARTMGAFTPARYIGNTDAARGCSYVIPADQLPAFQRFATAYGITLYDQPTAAPTRDQVPLPECSQCGQPAARTAQLQECPTCHAPWVPTQPEL